MAIRNILTLGDNSLRKKCRTVIDFDSKLNVLLDDMAETLHKTEGVGLASPQIGVLKRVIVIDIGNGVIELINPEIIKTKGSQETSEGCLSIPGKFGITRRPSFVSVKAQNRRGKEFTINGEDLMAKVLCHEIDHLDGKLFIDIVIRMLDPKELED
jgi:peptide deformylase